MRNVFMILAAIVIAASFAGSNGRKHKNADKSICPDRSNMLLTPKGWVRNLFSRFGAKSNKDTSLSDIPWFQDGRNQIPWWKSHHRSEGGKRIAGDRKDAVITRKRRGGKKKRGVFGRIRSILRGKPPSVGSASSWWGGGGGSGRSSIVKDDRERIDPMRPVSNAELEPKGLYGRKVVGHGNPTVTKLPRVSVFIYKPRGSHRNRR